MADFLRRRAFERLVRAHSADLYRFGYWLCRDRFAAEELVQETFARAWRSTGELRDPLAAKAWLFTILRRESARRFERERPALSLVAATEADIDIDLDWSGAGLRPSADDLIALRDALAELPATLSEPLLLQVLGGFECSEIAKIVDATEGAVMTRVCRARQRLREILRPQSAVPAAREQR